MKLNLSTISTEGRKRVGANHKNGEWITDWDFFKQIECAKDLALNCNYEKAIALYDVAETKLL